MDDHDYQDCQSDIRRIKELLNFGIFSDKAVGHTLLQSAFIELVICLSDLLAKTQKYANRISFTDDVTVTKNVADVTDAVRVVRNACCHIQSPERQVERGNRVLMVSYGKCNLYKSPEYDLTSDYEDDVAFFYGANRLYMNRHIVRAFEAAVEQLRPVMEAFSNNPFPDWHPDSPKNQQ